MKTVVYAVISTDGRCFAVYSTWRLCVDVVDRYPGSRIVPLSYDVLKKLGTY